MASTYSSNLRIEKIADGEQSGTWGQTTNTNWELVEDAISGYVSVTHSDAADYTLTTQNGAADEARNMILEISGTLTAARNVICPTQEKLYVVYNNTTGGYAITIKTSGGTGVSVANGDKAIVYCDGTNVVSVVNALGTMSIQDDTGVDINGGAIDGVTIGAAAAPTVTNLGSVATCDINGGTIDGVTIGASSAPTVTNLGSVATCDINGGTIDGVTIGGASAPTVTNLGSVATCDINGGTIDGVTIGGASAGAGTFTTVSATTFGTSSQNAYGARTVSTGAPSGGSDGDIHYKY